MVGDGLMRARLDERIDTGGNSGRRVVSS
jgi:hypothetical protein